MGRYYKCRGLEYSSRLFICESIRDCRIIISFFFMINYSTSDYGMRKISEMVSKILSKHRTPTNYVSIYGASQRNHGHEIFLNKFSSHILRSLKRRIPEEIQVTTHGVGNYTDGISIGFSKQLRTDNITLCAKIASLLCLITE